jgi:hypothetical protein
MVDRSAEDIQREIEQARVSLANAVDQIVYRTSPQRIGEQVKQTLKQKAQSPQGRAVIGAAGVIVVLLVVRRVRNH